MPKGHGTRPTPDRVREALFSMLGADVEGARVVELFGGTGSVGLEALSRGAAHALFFEVNAAALACLKENVDRLGVDDRVRIVRKDALKAARLLERDGPFDLAYCDPPHRLIEEPADRRRIEALLASLPLTLDGSALLEHRAGHLADLSPPGLRLTEVRKWGSTGIAFYVLPA